MPATKYTYLISVDFPNNKVDIQSLSEEIAASAIVTALQDINVAVTGPDNCDIWFVDVLSVGDQTILDGVVAAHQGSKICAHIYQSLQIIGEAPAAVTEVAAYEDLGGVQTTPAFFDSIMSQIVGRIIGEVKTDGAGAVMRSFEQVQGGAGTDMSGDIAIPDTAGAWQVFKFDSNTPPTDAIRNIYTLQAHKNAVANVEFRRVSISLMSVVIS